MSGEGARPGGAAGGADTDSEQEPRFHATLVKVLLVQVVALTLLWILQATYHG